MSRRRLHAALLGAVLGLASASPGAGQTSPVAVPAASAPTPPPVNPGRQSQVSVALFGGQVGENLARALDETAAAGVTLPSRTEPVGEKGSVCAILVRLQYPAPCDIFYPAVRRLNGGRAVDKEILQPNDTIQVPDLNLRIDRRRRVFAASETTTALSTTKANWRDLNLKLFPTGRADQIVEYDAYSVAIPVSDDSAAIALAARLRALKLPNTSVGERLKVPPAARLFTTAKGDDDLAEALRKECLAGPLSGERIYADWASVDRESRHAAQAAPSQPSTVVLIDTPLNAGPNLSQPALGPMDARPTWICAWRDPDVADHATYLAGIIASRSNGYGFQGVAPQAVIHAVPWEVIENGMLTPSEDAHQRVSDAFDAGTNSQAPLKVYLAALDFGIWEGKHYNDTLRFQHPLVRAIDEARRPLVVAAGQSRTKGVAGENITADTPLTPQNLGDRDYVVSVTACIDCTGEAVRLMLEANCSRDRHRFVHVAAPGGGPVPGWLGPDGIGLDRGTSPAAAFAAAVVTRMAAAYPGSYLEARQLKERVQTTSRPLPLFTVGLQPNPDLNCLAAGVIDPYVSLLDPRVTWVRKGGTWSPLKVQAINAPLFDLAQDPVGGGSKWLRRLMRTKDPINGDVWTALESAKRDPNALMGDVNTLRAVRPSSASTLLLCTGKSVTLASYDDILLPAGGLKADACAS